MFSVLTQRLRSLTGHTAVLEACDWDDDLMNRAFEDLNDAIGGYSGLRLDDLVDHIRRSMRERCWDDEIIKRLLVLVKTEVEGELNNIRGEA